MIRILIILLLLTGCTRYYYVPIYGDGNCVSVTANVPKTTDVSPTVDLDIIP